VAASPREIEEFRKDPDRWRPLLKLLLKYDRQALSDEFLDFSERVSEFEWLQEISYRQAEWTLGVRDKVRIVSSYRQFSLIALLKTLYLNRYDFAEHNERWIEAMFLSGVTEFRLYEAKRIYALSHSIGEVDEEDEAA
jgi:hypothetical protein